MTLDDAIERAVVDVVTFDSGARPLLTEQAMEQLIESRFVELFERSAT